MPTITKQTQKENKEQRGGDFRNTGHYSIDLTTIETKSPLLLKNKRQRIIKKMPGVHVLPKKNNVYFDYWMIEKARKDNKTHYFAVYLMILKMFPHRKVFLDKTVYAGDFFTDVGIECGVLAHQVRSAISYMMKIGFITKGKYKNGTFWDIKSLKVLRSENGIKNPGKTYYWDSNNISTYSELKMFLKVLPILSNINLQAKIVKRHHYLRKKVGSFLYKNSSKFRRNVDDELSKIQVKQAVNLAIKSIVDIIGCNSIQTAQTYKNFLVNKGLIQSKMREYLIAEYPDYETAINVYKYQSFEGIVLVKKNGAIVRRKSCTIIPNYDKEMVGIMMATHVI